jgi:hypothetical protein
LINWGDGSTSDGTVVADGTSSSDSTFVVTGSQKYTVKGTFSVKITVVDDDGNQAIASTSVSVGTHGTAAQSSSRLVTHIPKRIVSIRPATSRALAGGKAAAALAHPHWPLRALKR